MISLYFFLCVAVVVLFAIKLSNCADWFEKNTKLSGALVGFLLAATTSLPELVSGVTSVFIGQEELAISSILGSNLFNYNIVVVANLSFVGFFALNRLDKNTSKIIYFITSIYAVLIIALIFARITNLSIFDFRISLATVIITVIYIWSIFSLEGDEEVKNEYAHHYQVRKMIYKSIFFAIVIVISSSLLAKIVELVMFEFELSASLAGSVLLGASTSLPEFVSAIVLMRKRQYNVAVASVLSSNLFNFFVLFILDITTSSNILVYFTKDTYTLIIYGVINTLVMLITIKFYRVKNKFLYIIPSILVLAIYSVYLLKA